MLEYFYTAIGSLFFAAVLAYDTSELLYSEDPVDPVDAAVNIYLDVANLFVLILRLSARLATRK